MVWDAQLCTPSRAGARHRGCDGRGRGIGGGAASRTRAAPRAVIGWVLLPFTCGRQSMRRACGGAWVTSRGSICERVGAERMQEVESSGQYPATRSESSNIQLWRAGRCRRVRSKRHNNRPAQQAVGGPRTARACVACYQPGPPHACCVRVATGAPHSAFRAYAAAPCGRHVVSSPCHGAWAR